MGQRHLQQSKVDGVRPGSIIIHRDGAVAVVRERKTDNTGWWLVGFGGVADRALRSDNWIVPNMGELLQAVEQSQIHG